VGALGAPAAKPKSGEKGWWASPRRNACGLPAKTGNKTAEPPWGECGPFDGLEVAANIAVTRPTGKPSRWGVRPAAGTRNGGSGDRPGAEILADCRQGLRNWRLGGASVKTIAAALGDRLQTVQEALKFTRTGQRPKPSGRGKKSRLWRGQVATPQAALVTCRDPYTNSLTGSRSSRM